MPEAKIYTHIKNNDCDTFYREELSLRNEFQYPPYLKMAIVYLSSRSAKSVEGDAQKLGHILKSIGDRHFKDVEVYGPRVCNVEKRANQFTRMLLLKSNSVNQLHNLIQSMELNFKPQYSTSVKLDIDPVSIL